jgi:hypothetical protein
VTVSPVDASILTGFVGGMSAQSLHRTIIERVTDEWTTEEWLTPEDEEPLEHPPWRRRMITAVGVLVAAAMLAVPVWNVIDGATPRFSDSGLELCGFDYCVVQEGMREAGQGLTMSRLANTFLTEDDAQQLANGLVGYLGVEPVNVEVVDRLEGRIAGQYHPSTRQILLERPVRAWIVLHEVAHTVSSGHDDQFIDTLVALARWMEATEQ